MIARLTVHFPYQPAKTLIAREGGRYVLGRDSGCDIVLDDDRISRRHARLTSDGGAWSINDLGSKNGTLVDGHPVDSERLPERCWLSLGGLVCGFELVSEAARAAEEGARLERWRTSVALQRGLTPTVGHDELVRRLLDSVLELSGAERGFVLVTRADGELEIHTASGLEAEDLEDSGFSGSLGAIDRALAEGSVVATSDAQAETGLEERPSVVAHRIRALVCVPLQAVDRQLGVIYADSRKPGAAFDELDVEILNALASHAALAIAVTRLDSELRGLVDRLPTSAGVEARTASRIGDEILGALDRSLPEGRTDVGRGWASETWGAVVARHRSRAGVER